MLKEPEYMAFNIITCPFFEGYLHIFLRHFQSKVKSPRFNYFDYNLNLQVDVLSMSLTFPHHFIKSFEFVLPVVSFCCKTKLEKNNFKSQNICI